MVFNTKYLLIIYHSWSGVKKTYFTIKRIKKIANKYISINKSINKLKLSILTIIKL